MKSPLSPLSLSLSPTSLWYPPLSCHMELSVSTPSTQFSIQFSNEEYGWKIGCWDHNDSAVQSLKYKNKNEFDFLIINLYCYFFFTDINYIYITNNDKKDWCLIFCSGIYLYLLGKRSEIMKTGWKPDPSFLSDKKQVYSSSYQDYETATRTINSIEGSKWR